MAWRRAEVLRAVSARPARLVWFNLKMPALQPASSARIVPHPSQTFEQIVRSVNWLTDPGKARPYCPGMIKSPTQAMLEPQTDFSTDYALIAAGVGASLIALLYLLLV